MSNPAVIVLASRLGAGKSTLAGELHNLTEFPIISFGQYVKSVAIERSIVITRENLQNIGEELVIVDPQIFTQRAFGSREISAGAIVDGLRHKTVLEAIRRLAGAAPVTLVFIQTADGIRRERLLKRGMSDEEIARADSHQMEMALDRELLASSDMIVDGALSAQVNAEAIIASIAR